MKRYDPCIPEEAVPGSMCERAEGAYCLASDVDARIAELEQALRNSKRKHYFCDDSWYSCPMDPDGTANESKPKECDCGADVFNAAIDKVLGL